MFVVKLLVIFCTTVTLRLADLRTTVDDNPTQLATIPFLNIPTRVQRVDHGTVRETPLNFILRCDVGYEARNGSVMLCAKGAACTLGPCYANAATKCNFKKDWCGWTYEAKTPSIAGAHRDVMERYQWQYGLVLFLPEAQLLSPLYPAHRSADACVQLHVYKDDRDATGQFPLTLWLQLMDGAANAGRKIRLVMLTSPDPPLIYALLPTQCSDFRLVIEATQYMTFRKVWLLSGDACTNAFARMAIGRQAKNKVTESMGNDDESVYTTEEIPMETDSVVRD